MILPRGSHLLRIDHALRYILLASMVVGMLWGLPVGAAVAARGDSLPFMPAFTQVAELTKADCCANIGFSVGLSGNTAVLGAPGANSSAGEVLIFGRDATSGAWGITPVAVKSGSPDGAYFGRSVAIDGDTIAASANNDPWYDFPHDRQTAPAVYVFSRNAGGASAWGQTQTLKAETGDTGRFGASVAVSGKYLAVGSPVDDPHQCTYLSGSVYLYKQDDQGAWQLLKRVSPQGSQTFFGLSIALDGARLVVGAPSEPGRQGEAYLFGRDQGGADQWGLVTKLQPTATSPVLRYGWSVASHGSYIIIGAPSTYDGMQGAAYVFAQNAGAWGQLTQLNPPAGINAWQFGYAVSVDSGRVAVSAREPIQSSGAHPGAVYLFIPPASGTGSWELKDTVTVTNPQDDDRFGSSISLVGKTLLVGAPARVLTASCCEQGAGYVYDVGNPPGDNGGGDNGGGDNGGGDNGGGDNGGGDNGGGDNGGGDNGGGDNGGGDNGGGSTGAIVIDLNGGGTGDGYEAIFHEPVLPSTTFVPVPVVNPAALTITGPAGATLARATITLTNPQDGDKEQLQAAPGATITQSYSLTGGVGVLRLTAVGGSASLADFQAALRTVTYVNTSWKPNGSVQRIINFVVSSSNDNSNTAQARVTVLPEKELPIITFLVDGEDPLTIGRAYPVRFTVARPSMVGPEAGNPSGTVTIEFQPLNNGCTGTLDANGEGFCEVQVTNRGNFTVTATYSGDGEFLPRTQSLSYFFDYQRIFFPFFGRPDPPYDYQDSFIPGFETPGGVYMLSKGQQKR